MSWNYRILRKPMDPIVWSNVEGEKLYLYTIIEVYYDKDRNIEGWCEHKDILEWDELRDLTGTIKLLQSVIGKPILEEKDGTLVEIPIKQKEKNKNGKVDQSNN